MKLNKSIRLMLIGVMAMSFVACSNPETSKVESGSATPVEEQKDEAEVKQEEVVLVDDDLAKIVVTEKFNDEIFGPSYKVSVENKTDKKIIVQTRDVSIDGVMEEPIFSVEVTAGKKANDNMTFMNIESLEALKNLEGKLVIVDENFSDIKSYDMTIE
ncbi:hypothetical protein [Romboutsia ilealis]|uniref:hypothetical protein n=1 Tax=Romboutsia ilealis TaxID=1115758 RepID=UPI0023F53669|nr:hypothetical protein [Romboutsia ilealis]